MDKGFIGIWAAIVVTVAITFIVLLVMAHVAVSDNQRYIVDEPAEAAAALADETPTAIVFGSGLEDDGTPRPVLTARLDAALELYETGMIARIIVSGSADTDYHEPRAMSAYLREHGVPEFVIREDDKGDNTRATCERATDEFAVDEAVLVTQAVHLSRALYLCRSMDMTAYGYPAEPAGSQVAQSFQQLRETGAKMRAVFDALSGGGDRPEQPGVPANEMQ